MKLFCKIKNKTVKFQIFRGFYICIRFVYIFISMDLHSSNSWIRLFGFYLFFGTCNTQISLMSKNTQGKIFSGNICIKPFDLNNENMFKQHIVCWGRQTQDFVKGGVRAVTGASGMAAPQLLASPSHWGRQTTPQEQQPGTCKSVKQVRLFFPLLSAPSSFPFMLSRTSLPIHRFHRH